MTIGYEGISSSAFYDLLHRNHVDLVIDVRWSNFSYRPEFRNSTFEKLCHANGLDYVHLSEFGVPSRVRKESPSRSQIARWYKRHLKSVDCSPVLQALKKKSVALVCYEAHAEDCHRSLLAAFLNSQFGIRHKDLRDEACHSG